MKQAAKALGMSFSWLDKQVSDGKIEIVTMGKKRMMTVETIEKIKKDGVKC